MEIISKMEARKRGLRRYFTNRWCCNLHLNERRVCDGMCIDCANLKKRLRRARRRLTVGDAIVECQEPEETRTIRAVRLQRCIDRGIAAQLKLARRRTQPTFISLARAAAARGETHFISDRPCPRGHLSPRRARDADCLECVREDRRKPAARERQRRKHQRKMQKYRTAMQALKLIEERFGHGDDAR